MMKITEYQKEYRIPVYEIGAEGRFNLLKVYYF
jgi:hypothetical protein